MANADLFGSVEDDPIKSFKNDYDEYIRSARWRLKRSRALASVDGCEMCGRDKRLTKLEVHHKTYENFKNEKPKDLIVLCKDCHRKQDEVRRDEVSIKRNQKMWDARLDGWATKVYGKDWHERDDVNFIQDEFYEWLEQRER